MSEFEDEPETIEEPETTEEIEVIEEPEASEEPEVIEEIEAPEEAPKEDKQIEKEREPLQPITYVIAGLGNYGNEYRNTRHNAGFMAIDFLAQRLGVSITRAKFHALTAEAVIAGKRVLLMKPQLYMNRSGESVRDAADFYKIPPENVLVLCDDINLDVGKLRIRRKGSDGGQKGLRDIIYHLTSDAFPRIRMGVGKVPQGGDVVSWVLGRIPETEREAFAKVLEQTADAIPMIIEGKIDLAMGKYN